MSLPASRAVMRQSRFMLRRTAFRNASTTAEATQKASEGASKAKETASAATSKASEGLSRVSSSAGSGISRYTQGVTSFVSRIGGRTGRMISFVECEYTSLRSLLSDKANWALRACCELHSCNYTRPESGKLFGPYRRNGVNTAADSESSYDLLGYSLDTLVAHFC